MTEKEFNLLREPWIIVMKPDGATDTVSLIDALANAGDYRGLAGEMPSQDAALLRLMLALLHAVFGRYDVQGREAPLAAAWVEPGDALERWQSLWEAGAFPMDVIEAYLAPYADRFYLFHPQHPFYQILEPQKATEFTGAKLNGEISQGGNKIRLFAPRAGQSQGRLPYAEAARWLLHINAYDDSASKPVNKSVCDGSPGAGWLGQLGLLYAMGDTLFETLMLNLVLLPDGEDRQWGAESPIWEKPMCSLERRRIPIPDNPSGLLTLQSRRIYLRREGSVVTGFALLCGDFFEKENAFVEQMTLWRNTNSKTAYPIYVPKRHQPEKKLWRDFMALAAQGEQSHRPGITGWIARLRSDGLLDRPYLRFQTVGMAYDAKGCSIVDAFSDSISFHADLLIRLGESWIGRVDWAVEVAEGMAQEAGQLAKALVKCVGASDGEGERAAALGQAYYRLDLPFCQWLASIDPRRDGSQQDAICLTWLKAAQGVIRELGREMVEEAGTQAFIGREEQDKRNKNKKNRYTAPEVYNRFLRNTATERFRR